MDSECDVTGECAPSALALPLTFPLQDEANCNEPLSCPSGYPDLSLNIFGLIKQLADFTGAQDEGDSPNRRRDVSAYDITKAFFHRTVQSLRVVEKQITLEFLCGGLPEELSKMRSRVYVARPISFPTQFTRMWLSNVP